MVVYLVIFPTLLARQRTEVAVFVALWVYGWLSAKTGTYSFSRKANLVTSANEGTPSNNEHSVWHSSRLIVNKPKQTRKIFPS
jgi:hypothetical protein